MRKACLFTDQLTNDRSAELTAKPISNDQWWYAHKLIEGLGNFIKSGRGDGINLRRSVVREFGRSVVPRAQRTPRTSRQLAAVKRLNNSITQKLKNEENPWRLGGEISGFRGGTAQAPVRSP